MRKGRKPRRNNAIEYASAKQTIALGNDPVNGVFRLDDVNLSSFDRCVQIARAYQYFRIKKIEYKFKPLADTFYGPNPTPSTPWQSVPQLYWLIMKSDTLNANVNGFDGLRDAGAKSVRFDDKQIVVRWRPTVAQGVSLSEANNTTSYASYRTSPWLSTNKNVMLPGGITTWAPSEVPHLGLLYGVQQDYQTTDILPYGVEITVHMDFKKPLQLTVDASLPPATKKEVIPKSDPVIV